MNLDCYVREGVSEISVNKMLAFAVQFFVQDARKFKWLPKVERI